MVETSTRAAAEREPGARGEGDPRSSGSVIRQGILAGVVGATILAFWFLVVDALAGQPLRTPGFLAGALLGQEGLDISMGGIALFTVIHYAIWVAVGVLVSWFLSLLSVAAPLLLGVILGFALFAATFYGSVIVAGVDVVARLGWPAVLAGDVLAGVGALLVLHRAGATRRVPWYSTLAHNSVVRNGVIAGLIAAAVVAAWFLLLDLLQGRPLFTPAALGSVLFFGAESADQVRIGATTVLGYTAVHVAAFLGAGLIAAALFGAAEDTPPVILGALLLFVAFEAFFLGAMALLSEFLLGSLAWWNVAVGNLLAALVAGAWLVKQHPRVRQSLTTQALPDEP